MRFYRKAACPKEQAAFVLAILFVHWEKRRPEKFPWRRITGGLWRCGSRRVLQYLRLCGGKHRCAGKAPERTALFPSEFHAVSAFYSSFLKDNVKQIARRTNFIQSRIEGFAKSPSKILRMTKAINKIRMFLTFIFLVDVVQWRCPQRGAGVSSRRGLTFFYVSFFLWVW